MRVWRYTQLEMSPVYALFHYLFYSLHHTFFRGEVAGIENIPITGPFLLAANHASHLDPAGIGGNVPRQLAFFARKTLWKGGVLSWWMDQAGCIPVDRDGGSDVSAIKRVLRALQDGRALLLFPEGTRSPDGELQPPKSGAGMIACRAKVPVVPVRIFNSNRAWGRGGPLKLGQAVDITYGPALQLADFDDPTAGKQRYQVASEHIMAAIAKLEPAPTLVV